MAFCPSHTDGQLPEAGISVTGDFPSILLDIGSDDTAQFIGAGFSSDPEISTHNCRLGGE
jgi:hypothetical protein